MNLPDSEADLMTAEEVAGLVNRLEAETRALGSSLIEIEDRWGYLGLGYESMSQFLHYGIREYSYRLLREILSSARTRRSLEGVIVWGPIRPLYNTRPPREPKISE